MSAEIRIGKDYKITSDPHNWILNKIRIPEEGKHAGDEVLDAVGFFPTLRHLSAGLMELRLKEADVTTIGGLADKILEIKRELWDALPARKGGEI